MKNISVKLQIALAFATLLAGNASYAQRGAFLKDFSTSTLVSLPVPQHFDGDINYLDKTGIIANKSVTAIKHDNTILPSFPNSVSSVTAYKIEDDGSLNYMGNAVSEKNSEYEVIYDYTLTQSILVDDSSFALVGVSVRMVAKVKTKVSGINLASIEGLGVAVDHKKVSGSLEVRVNGISSERINAQIPVTTDLSPASISNALQSVAIIKSHIYDDETKITPLFLAVSQGIGDGSPKLQSNYNRIINAPFHRATASAK
jgi:hypothetical protein